MTRLARLPDEQRVVVALHLFEGFSFREIADVEHVPHFTIASRYRLALRRLRREAGVETQ
jgi:DNA-directed RNA polymerase specialized sigma24 family protein